MYIQFFPSIFLGAFILNYIQSTYHFQFNRFKLFCIFHERVVSEIPVGIFKLFSYIKQCKKKKFKMVFLWYFQNPAYIPSIISKSPKQTRWKKSKEIVTVMHKKKFHKYDDFHQHLSCDVVICLTSFVFACLCVESEVHLKWVKMLKKRQNNWNNAENKWIRLKPHFFVGEQ